MCCDSPSPPDYGPIAAANDKAAEYAYKAAQDDLAFRQKVYQDSLPRQQELMNLATNVVNQQLDIGNFNQQRAQEQWQQYQNMYAPAEAGVFMDAYGGAYLSPEEQAQMAQYMQQRYIDDSYQTQGQQFADNGKYGPAAAQQQQLQQQLMDSGQFGGGFPAVYGMQNQPDSISASLRQSGWQPSAADSVSTTMQSDIMPSGGTVPMGGEGLGTGGNPYYGPSGGSAIRQSSPRPSGTGWNPRGMGEPYSGGGQRFSYDVDIPRAKTLEQLQQELRDGGQYTNPRTRSRTLKSDPNMGEGGTSWWEEQENPLTYNEEKLSAEAQRLYDAQPTRETRSFEYPPSGSAARQRQQRQVDQGWEQERQLGMYNLGLKGAQRQADELSKGYQDTAAKNSKAIETLRSLSDADLEKIGIDGKGQLDELLRTGQLDLTNLENLKNSGIAGLENLKTTGRADLENLKNSGLARLKNTYDLGLQDIQGLEDKGVQDYTRLRDDQLGYLQGREASDRAGTQANINNAYAQQARNMMRAGGDPTRMMGAAANLANQQALSRVTGYNQIRQGYGAQNRDVMNQYGNKVADLRQNLGQQRFGLGQTYGQNQLGIEQGYGQQQYQLGQDIGQQQQQLGREYGQQQYQVGQDYGNRQADLRKNYGEMQAQLGQYYGGQRAQLGQNVGQQQFNLAQGIGQQRATNNQQYRGMDYNNQAAANEASRAAIANRYAQQQGMRSGVANFGRNMPNTAAQAFGLSTQAGNSAMGNQNASYMSGLPYAQFQSGAYGTQMGAAGLAQQGALGYGNILNQGYGIQAQNSGNFLGDLGTLAGIGMQMYRSDRRLKENIEQVGTTKHGLPLYEFNYRFQPDVRYRGVMADDVEKVMPEAIGEEGGYKFVNYSMLGVRMEVVKEEEVRHG